MEQVYTDVPFSRIEGSNNWVVSGKKTASGKPILANDPHRAITNPAVRYITHLVAPGWDVIGAGEPASPGVAIGHNDRIAFGLTIVGMDQQDIYLEKLVPCASAGETCYLYNGHPHPITSVVDTIRIRDAAPRIVSLQYTRHCGAYGGTGAGHGGLSRFALTRPRAQLAGVQGGNGALEDA
jgi:penicillin amidase